MELNFSQVSGSRRYGFFLKHFMNDFNYHWLFAIFFYLKTFRNFDQELIINYCMLLNCNDIGILVYAIHAGESFLLKLFAFEIIVR